MDPRPIEAENLIRSGCLKGLGTIPDLLDSMKGMSWSTGQLPLFESVQPSKDDWSLAERVHAQQEILGIAVDAHPLELVLAEIKDTDLDTTIEVVDKVGKKVRLVGTKLTWPRTFAAEKGSMAFLTLEDLEGMVDVIIPPDVFRKYRRSVYASGPLLIEGTVETSSNRVEPAIRAENIISLSEGAIRVRKYP